MTKARMRRNQECARLLVIARWFVNGWDALVQSRHITTDDETYCLTFRFLKAIQAGSSDDLGDERVYEQRRRQMRRLIRREMERHGRDR